MPKFSICIEAEEESRQIVSGWLLRWRNHFGYLSDTEGCGCCVDIYEIDGPLEAIAELPEEYVSMSMWSDWRCKADYFSDTSTPD